MSEIKTFYINVYKPVSIHEYEIEVHPDLIGLEDENQANDSAEQEAMRIAMQKARRGENKDINNIGCEFIALMWGADVEIMSTFILEDGKKDIAELRKLLTKHAPEATPVFQKLKEMEDESRQWNVTQSGRDRGSGQDSGKAQERNGGGDPAEGIQKREENERLRTTTRNKSSRRVAKIQRRRNSRAC
jgi:hypothetical protein